MSNQYVIYTLKNSNIDWSVSKPNYITKSDSLNIQENTILYVSLNEEINYNKLTIITQPSDATVTYLTNGTINGNSITVRQNTTVKYVVSKDGYHSKSGEFTIKNVDETIYVSLVNEETFKYNIKNNTESEFTYTINFIFGLYNYLNNEEFKIDWGDGSEETVIKDGNINSENCTHTYNDSTKMYTISISSSNNVMPYINMYNETGNTISVLTPFLKMIDIYGNEIKYYTGFYNCEHLESLPNELFSNNSQIIRFRSNDNSSSIRFPDETYYDFEHKYHGLYINYHDNCQYTIHTMGIYLPNGCFQNCLSLKEIPEDLFDYTQNVTDFDSCFMNSGLEHIPEKLFYNTKEVTSFTGTFYGCKNLISNRNDLLPKNLFYNNKNATHYNATFAYCTSLECLPENLFRSNLKIPGIQNPVFENYGNGKHFNLTFKGCTNLKYGIDGGYYNNEYKDITLYDYLGDEEHIYVPSEVDSPNINVSNYDYKATLSDSTDLKPQKYVNASGIFPNTAETFNETFMNCKNLLYVPKNTFNLCSNNATEFLATFYGCENLEEVGNDLLSHLLKAYLFGNIYSPYINHMSSNVSGDNHGNPRGMFAYCNKLRINPNIFGDLDLFFYEKDDIKFYFGSMFFRKEFTGSNIGSAPRLWEYDNGDGNISGEHCFAGNGNKNLSNYNDIPEVWKKDWFFEGEYADNWWSQLEQDGSI